MEAHLCLVLKSFPVYYTLTRVYASLRLEAVLPTSEKPRNLSS